MVKIKPGLDSFFMKLSKKKLLQLDKEFTQNKLDGAIKIISQVISSRYGVDQEYALYIIQTNVQRVLNIKKKLNPKLKKKNEPKES